MKEAYNTVKSYLQYFTGGLKAVYDSINLLLANQHASYEAEIALNKSGSPHTALEPLFSQLLGRVLHYALG